MITIIHGDDTVSSRNYYLSQKTEQSISFDGEKLTLTDLVQIMEGSSLFLETKKIFIDNFLSKRKIGHEFEEIISFINNHSKDNNVFFWEGKEISKKNLSLFENSTVKTYKLPQMIFTFLDNIKPKSTKNVLFFHEALLNSETELIFFMLIRQFRLLLALSDDLPGENIDEAKRLAPWQKSKLKKQSLLFSISELKGIYKKLYEIDLGLKTGTLNMTLLQAIDILLLDI